MENVNLGAAGAPGAPGAAGAAEAVSAASASGAPGAAEAVSAAGGSAAGAKPSAIRIPALRAADLDPMQFAQSTCFQAGHLVTKNAGWRQVRPVIDPQKCTGCLQCYLYCPDGTIRKTHAEKDDQTQAAVFVDLDFCKGCGICRRVCKFDAISMVPESEVE